MKKYIKTLTTSLILSLLFCGAEQAAAQNRRFKQSEAQAERQQKKLERRQEKLQDRINSGEQPMRPQQIGRALDGMFGGGIEARLWVRTLNLTQDQIRKMIFIRRRSSDEYLSLEGQIREKRLALDMALYSDQMNEEEVKQLAVELSRLEGQRVLMKTKIQAQIRSLLTPDQLKIVREMRFGAGNSAPKNETPQNEQEGDGND
ncbi:MAG: hypothetical protein JNN15_00540 [Blastocatellia bacterium]|nr:hypothetical protein [Blastocatellia bacterium]